MKMTYTNTLMMVLITSFATSVLAGKDQSRSPSPQGRANIAKLVGEINQAGGGVVTAESLTHHTLPEKHGFSGSILINDQKPTEAQIHVSHEGKTTSRAITSSRGWGQPNQFSSPKLVDMGEQGKSVVWIPAKVKDGDVQYQPTAVTAVKLPNGDLRVGHLGTHDFLEAIKQK